MARTLSSGTSESSAPSHDPLQLHSTLLCLLRVIAASLFLGVCYLDTMQCFILASFEEHFQIWLSSWWWGDEAKHPVDKAATHEADEPGDLKDSLPAHWNICARDGIGEAS